MQPLLEAPRAALGVWRKVKGGAFSGIRSPLFLVTGFSNLFARNKPTPPQASAPQALPFSLGPTFPRTRPLLALRPSGCTIVSHSPTLHSDTAHMVRSGLRGAIPLPSTPHPPPPGRPTPALGRAASHLAIDVAAVCRDGAQVCAVSGSRQWSAPAELGEGDHIEDRRVVGSG